MIYDKSDCAYYYDNRDNDNSNSNFKNNNKHSHYL